MKWIINPYKLTENIYLKKDYERKYIMNLSKNILSLGMNNFNGGGNLPLNLYN